MGSNTNDSLEDDMLLKKINAKCKLEIVHNGEFTDDIGNIYNCPEFSDCTIKVNDTTFYLHKAILASRSKYFRAMLFGGLSINKSSPIEIHEDDPEIFEHLLRYIYTGTLKIDHVNAQLLLDILTMANRYGFINLEDAIANELQCYKTLENVLSIFEISNLFNLKELSDSCLQTIDEHSNSIWKYVDFTNLSKDTLVAVLKRDSFYLPEEEIFIIVSKWHQCNDVSPIEEVTDCVRLPLISTEALFGSVRDSKLWDSDTLFEVLRIKNLLEKNSNPENLQCFQKCFLCKQRGCLIIEENLATYNRNASIIEGEYGPTFLNGDNLINDADQCYAKHAIDNQSAIVIKLENPSIINHIKMLLRCCDNRSYSYIIELSNDKRNWSRVVDYLNYPCRSWQYIYLAETVTQYIRICGVSNNDHKQFNILSINIRFTRNPLETLTGIIVPKTNVAVPPCASVISGVSRVRNALIDGNYTVYDWDSGYTCHQLGSGYIMIQLGQPYIIGSCRLLLWDKDDRIYSYTVETSVDGVEFIMAADRTTKQCRSWQNLTFSPRPTIYIKITGIRNTANEVFHCVHFECPSTLENQ